MIDNSKTQTKDSQSAISPAMAVQMLKDGNQRFLSGNTLSRNISQQVAETGSGQFPFAAVLACIDSRVPAEIIFDQGMGDIFSARVAGNFVNTDILGSLEFACKAAGSKAILVLGHTHCGAVKGACDDVQLGNLTAMLANLKPAVDSVTDETERNSGNAAFVQKVSDANVGLTIAAIRSKSAVLNEMEQNGEITIVGGMYDVENGQVSFMDS